MSAWLTRHAQTSIGSLGRLSQQKFATLLTVFVIGIALALPACLHLLISNAQMATGSWNNAVDLTVFLKRPTSAEEATRTATRIQQRRDVSNVEVITSDNALKEFRRDSGFGSAIDALNENPLPHTLVVTPAAEFTTAAHLDSLAADLRELPSVEIVQLDTAWVNRLNAILDTVRRGLVVAAALLAIGVMVIVGNTIRLDIQNRRAEIEVTKLVGGSDAFVRRPFLYNGIWYGLGGGLIAWLITLAVTGILREPIGRLAGLYGSAFELGGLDPKSTLILLGAGIVLGWLGSYLAASRHLRAIEPT
ncbi:MAG TPA: permease-like cell division protein FtsX [Steroidobacter sp.]|uniref:permease-like cell division protein FtsX n=1 Tax=Steroidobacter sp. TaxID=1978227 RepID=UPI002ED9330C